MVLRKIDAPFAVCKISDISMVDFTDKFCFLGKTDEEISLVCAEDKIPENVTDCEKGWRAFRIEGVLDFSLIGILSGIASCLAENKIGIFAVSTYNTDYILTKAENYDKALAALRFAGYEIV